MKNANYFYWERNLPHRILKLKERLRLLGVIIQNEQNVIHGMPYKLKNCT